MWGKVWILPLCTVIVAIISAPSASGVGCSCGDGGPTSTDKFDITQNQIDPLLCGPDDVVQCDTGEVCVCDYTVDTEITNLQAVITG
ncbi:unnamed protein product, partial [Ectocarpus sp. 13 AM-2016]